MSSWYESDIITNGIRIHYYRTGGSEGSNKPQVVLCHGYSDNALCWTRMAQSLESDYDLILVDARCHGQSEAPREGNDTPAMAADLAGIITGLELDQPICAGHSMGAAYVAYAASRYPQLMRAVILEDPPWRDPVAGQAPLDRDAMALQRRHEIEVNQAMPFDALIAHYREHLSGWPEEAYQRFAQAKRELDPRILSATLLGREPWRETLSGIQCPILVFTGETWRGAIVDEKVMADIMRIHPDTVRVHVPDVGHHIRFRRFDVVEAAIKAFLSRQFGDAA